ncbi:fibrinogen-like protein 1 [Anopheles aquasalis]|uniref:fibrinogen-like protein 1 n=1 Tax=Anopheles aquasalis TaxID=42839 RepID=UPI00215B1DC5|nr:fibrinogen-like protein 1 [Anopheles aquasalis]
MSSMFRLILVSCIAASSLPKVMGYDLQEADFDKENKKMREDFGIRKRQDNPANSIPTCKNVTEKVSGIYNISGSNRWYDSFQAYCEQEAHNGGWMIIQHRKDGRLNFNRDWNDYENGFGQVDGEMWLGLKLIRQFTQQYHCELLVEMKDFKGNYKYAKYDSFAIGFDKQAYKLSTLGKHSGTAADSLRGHVGIKFSTKDQDNDETILNHCAEDWEGGWWFNNCFQAFLNGLYTRNTNDENGILWDGFSNNRTGLSHTRMMIRPY